jgi:UDP-3-O-[3-hydroxymyristoyl] glucosamine N-acyltransferase
VTRSYTASELAQHLGAAWEGQGDPSFVGVKGLLEAEPEHISFLANPRYSRHMDSSRAGAVLVSRDAHAGTTPVLRCDDPYVAFAEALSLFHPPRPRTASVDPRAFVAPDAQVDGATIQAFAWIGPGAVVLPGTLVEAGAIVGEGARVGRDGHLMHHSVVAHGCTIGDRVTLNPGAVIGGDGFGFAPSPRGHVKIPQVGRAVLGDDVEIGSNSCVDRAAMDETRVETGAKLDNLVQVGHAAKVGEDALMVAYSGVAGSSTLGRGVVLGAKAAVLGHLQVGDGVHVGTASVVHRDTPPGSEISGIPAIDHRQWRRAAVALSELPDLLKQVRRLESRIIELEAQLHDKERNLP